MKIYPAAKANDDEPKYLTEEEVRAAIAELLARFPTLRENLRDR